MSEWDNLLKTKSTSTGSSDFGNLKDNGTYNMTVSEARMLDSGSLLVKAKTISGSTGLGSFVSGFYSLRTPDGDKITEKFADMDKDALKKLVVATGIPAPTSLEGMLDHVAKHIIDKSFKAQIKEGNEYNGNRQFNIKSFTVAAIGTPEVSPGPLHDIAIDTTSTSSDKVESDFSFD